MPSALRIALRAPRPSALALTAASVLLAAACLPGPAWGQNWTGGPTGPISYTGGNVGIGTTSPSSPLGVVANTYPSYGTAYFWRSDLGGYYSHIQYGGNGDWYIRSSLAAGKVILQDTGGNVGIGTTSPQYLLSVNGTIGTKEVLVTGTGWSDYVFQPGYRLRPLSEVGAYIQQHHHLPEIPSEAEVKEKGVSLGEMQSKLLAKIEELTLHMIRAEEKNNRLEDQNRELQERLARLEVKER